MDRTPAINPIYIADLGHDGLIEGATFERKRIMGPAVLFPERIIINGGGAHGSVGGALWRFPEGDGLIQGFITLRDCVFEACSFENIGWVSDDLDALRQVVGKYYDGDDTPPQIWSPQNN